MKNSSSSSYSSSSSHKEEEKNLNSPHPDIGKRKKYALTVEAKS
jgi:hypothetical protein